MYPQTQAQIESERKLEAQGFRFANWIPAQPDANNEPMTEHGCMVMVKRNGRHGREMREIEPDGSIN